MEIPIRYTWMEKTGAKWELSSCFLPLCEIWPHRIQAAGSTHHALTAMLKTFSPKNCLSNFLQSSCSWPSFSWCCSPGFMPYLYMCCLRQHTPAPLFCIFLPSQMWFEHKLPSNHFGVFSYLPFCFVICPICDYDTRTLFIFLQHFLYFDKNTTWDLPS